MRLSVLLLATFAASCGSPDATRAYFSAHQGDFAHIVQLVETCRPTHHFVSHDGLDLDGTPAGTRCANTRQDIRMLHEALTGVGADWAAYDTRSDDPEVFNPLGEIFQVEIAPERGCQTFVYEFEADPDGGEHIYRPEADEYERYPLTSAPYHWFCESIGF